MDVVGVVARGDLPTGRVFCFCFCFRDEGRLGAISITGARGAWRFGEE
jgi:hypothetical protein